MSKSTKTSTVRKKPLTYKQALRRKGQLEAQIEKLSARMAKLFTPKQG